MPWWSCVLVSIAVFAVVYAAFVLWLVLLGRRSDARALATFIPDCIVLTTRLVRDPRVPRRRKLMLVALVAYLSLPFDLVPDFIPVAGQPLPHELTVWATGWHVYVRRSQHPWDRCHDENQDNHVQDNHVQLASGGEGLLADVRRQQTGVVGALPKRGAPTVERHQIKPRLARVASRPPRADGGSPSSQVSCAIGNVAQHS